MNQLLLRNLDRTTKARLKRQAADHGRSMSAEACALIRAALDKGSSSDLATAIRTRVARVGGVELKIPPRTAARPLPDFD